jgi:hypothetical protein
MAAVVVVDIMRSVCLVVLAVVAVKALLVVPPYLAKVIMAAQGLPIMLVVAVVLVRLGLMLVVLELMCRGLLMR